MKRKNSVKVSSPADNFEDVGDIPASVPELRNNPEVKPDDVVIAVMGVTGAGKSTFIQYFTEEVLSIGHSLESCTLSVQIYSAKLRDGKKLFLVDTPGFDDTNRSDTEVLRELAGWLTAAYTDKILLTGIIYLHRISDVRLGGAAMKNLRMFKRLCGENGLGSVVLGTTMWSHISMDMAVQRENELQKRDDFWKTMIGHGSKVFRQDEGRDSALKILQYLISKRRMVTLDIQHDMVDRGLRLDQTGAGQEVQSEIEKLRKKYEQELQRIRDEMAKAMADKDKEQEEELKEFKAEVEVEMQKQREDLERIQADRDQLRQEVERRHAMEREKLLKKLQENETKIAFDEKELEILRIKHAHDLDVQKLQLELQTKENEKERIKRRLQEYHDRQCIVM